MTEEDKQHLRDLARKEGTDSPSWAILKQQAVAELEQADAEARAQDEMALDMLASWEQGMGYAEIGRLFGLTTSTVQGRIKALFHADPTAITRPVTPLKKRA